MSDVPDLTLHFFKRTTDDGVYVRVADLLGSLRTQADRLGPEYEIQAQVMRNMCDALEADATFAEIVTEPPPPAVDLTVGQDDPTAAARGCLAGLGLMFLALLLLGGCVTLGRLVF